ncbi:hypothetical protein BC830DRAFT_1094948, partial [Chytriomyces sp. MP71]
MTVGKKKCIKGLNPQQLLSTHTTSIEREMKFSTIACIAFTSTAIAAPLGLNLDLGAGLNVGPKGVKAGVAGDANVDAGALGHANVGGAVQADAGVGIKDGKLEQHAGVQAAGHANANVLGLAEAKVDGNVKAGEHASIGKDGVDVGVGASEQTDAKANALGLVSVNAHSDVKVGTDVQVDPLHGKVSVDAGVKANAGAGVDVLGAHIDANLKVDINAKIAVRLPIVAALFKIESAVIETLIHGLMDVVLISEDVILSIVESLASIQLGVDVHESIYGIAVKFHVSVHVVLVIAQHLLPLLPNAYSGYTVIQTACSSLEDDYHKYQDPLAPNASGIYGTYITTATEVVTSYEGSSAAVIATATNLPVNIIDGFMYSNSAVVTIAPVYSDAVAATARAEYAVPTSAGYAAPSSVFYNAPAAVSAVAPATILASGAQ